MLGTQRQFVNLLLEFRDVIPLPGKIQDMDFNEVNEVFRMKWVLKVRDLSFPFSNLTLNRGILFYFTVHGVAPRSWSRRRQWVRTCSFLISSSLGPY